MTIKVGSDIQSAIDANPTGTTFCIDPGTYRLTAALAPKTDDALIGLPGTVLSGSKLLTSWTKNGSQWTHTGDMVNPGSLVGECDDGTDACLYPDDVFLDDTRLVRVLSLSSLSVGEVYIDYSANKVYLADDPTGRKVEYAVAEKAIDGDGADSVTISGLIIEKFATPAQQGALATGYGSSWLVTDNEVRLNHGGGIDSPADGSVVSNNHVHHNGQLGMHAGNADNLLIEGNEIDHNNTAGYDIQWEAGGSKWVKTTGLVVKGNYSHDNVGPGLWTDIDNIFTTYDGNIAENNVGPGIYHEISYDATITNNVVTGNGLVEDTWLDGAGILVSSSPNVEVYGNTVDSNGDGIGLKQVDRGDGEYGPHELENVYVHDNIVTITQGDNGLVENVGDQSFFTSRNNRFEANTYRLPDGDEYFAWMDLYLTFQEWLDYGQK